MKRIHPDSTQASAIVQALHAVASARGALPLLPVELESIEAIQRHLLHLAEPLAPVGKDLPADLESVIPDAVMRRQVVRLLALLPVIDGEVSARKAAVVEEAARRLAVDDVGLVLLRQAVARRFTRMAFGLMWRSVAHYWSPTGRVRLRDAIDMLRIGMPSIPGLYDLLRDRRLLARYEGLGARPEGTLGHALYRFYRDNGFALPGEPKSFPEGWSRHEVYHVVSGYSPTDQGEMLNAAFSAGNTEVLCMDLLMLTLLQFQAGFRVMPGPVLKGELRPDAFFRAVARGATMRVDLLDGWDLWTAVDLPLEQARRQWEVPALSETERERLAGWNALMPA